MAGDIEDDRGFTLQPIDSLSQQQQQHHENELETSQLSDENNNDSDSEDSPPTDSLRSIKSRAEEKRRQQRLLMSAGSKQLSLTSTYSSRATSSKVRRDLSRVLGESGSAGMRRKPSPSNLYSNSKTDVPRKRKFLK